MNKYLIVIISFFIELSLSLIFYKNTIFLNTFSLLSIYIIYPFFKNNKRKFFIIIIILGFIYDLVCSSIFGVNLILFFISAVIIAFIYDNFSVNYLNSLTASILMLIIYRFLTYFAFIKVNKLGFDFKIFISSIYSTLILNTCYITMLYFLLRKRMYKLKY